MVDFNNEKTKQHTIVKMGLDYYKKEKGFVHLLDDNDANNFLNDLKNYPHAFVLACFMDRRIKAERAWKIPVIIKEKLSSFDMDVLCSKSLEDYKTIFCQNNLHIYNETMAEVFYNAINRIHKVYHDNVAEIWNQCPSSAEVVYRFLEFQGVGIKIATMTANILARQFKIKFSDYYSIDVSPDVHVKRVLYRLGFVEEKADNNKIIYKMRDLYPDFPGIVDYSLWNIGRKWCHPKNPDCDNCEAKKECAKFNAIKF